jgi:hypothetical protein
VSQEYIQIVNYARIIFVYIIQLLYDNNVRLNNNLVQKFLVMDSELDSQERKEVSSKILSYDFVKSRVDTNKRIGKINNKNILDLKALNL